VGDNMKTIVIGLLMIVIALAMFPIVLDSVAAVLAWTSGGSSISTFTGLEALVKISPLLIFIALLAGGGWLTFEGFKSTSSGGGSKSSRGLH